MFAYSRKGLPHALKHAPELVKTFGHHAGPCTHLGEMVHKVDIKEAAELAGRATKLQDDGGGLRVYR